MEWILFGCFILQQSPAEYLHYSPGRIVVIQFGIVQGSRHFVSIRISSAQRRTLEFIQTSAEFISICTLGAENSELET